MPTLVLLTAILSSLSPESARSSPFQLRVAPSMTLPAPRDPAFHLTDTMGNEQINDETANRIFLEFLAGTAVGLLGGGLTALALGSKLESPTSLVIPVSVLLLGGSTGVTLVGSMMNGRGRFGYALLGSTISCVAPLILGIGMIHFSGCAGSSGNGCGEIKPVVASLLWLFVVPSVGAMVGYELSAPKSWLLLARAPEETPAPRQFAPVLSLASQGLGATVGLAGTL
ncbi:MAG: hypothetical protein ACJ8AT_07770 [Hyalangium sp.]|uniref:hypothetical protein n=1 Tax=Hyalangium sp. TaxID=2028555 RepID=UPI00389A0DB2